MGEEISSLNMLLRLSATVFFVGLIGYERQKKHKIAGLTTHIMVAIGACAIAILQEMLACEALAFVKQNPDLQGSIVIEKQRIIAQVIPGVGFLGAGAILKTKENVIGLTTASTLWISALIGIIFGIGKFELGISVSVLGLIILTFIRWFIFEILGKKGKIKEEEVFDNIIDEESEDIN